MSPEEPPRSTLFGRRSRWACELIEGAGSILEKGVGHVGVNLRRTQASVPQQHLNGPQVRPAFHQVGGKAVPKRMQGHPLMNAGGVLGLLEDFSQSMRVVGFLTSLAHEKPGLGTVDLPVVPEEGQEMRGKHDVPVLTSLALLDTNDHAMAVDLAHL